jgi:hypothetical protein
MLPLPNVKNYDAELAIKAGVQAGFRVICKAQSVDVKCRGYYHKE